VIPGTSPFSNRGSSPVSPRCSSSPPTPGEFARECFGVVPRPGSRRCSRPSSSGALWRRSDDLRPDDGAEGLTMALEGTLRDFSLADILQLIALQAQDGAPERPKPVRHPSRSASSTGCSSRRSPRRSGSTPGSVPARQDAPAIARGPPEGLGDPVADPAAPRFILLKNGFCTAQDLRDGSTSRSSGSRTVFSGGRTATTLSSRPTTWTTTTSRRRRSPSNASSWRGRAWWMSGPSSRRSSRLARSRSTREFPWRSP